MKLKMKNILTGLLLTLSLTATAQLAIVDNIVAVVDDNVVLYSEIKQRIDDIEKTIKSTGQELPPKKYLLDLVLDRLIDERLQLNLAIRMGVELTDEAIEQAVKNLALQQGMSTDSFYQNAIASGMDKNRLKQQVANELIINEVQKYFVNQRIIITEAEVTRFLASKEGQFWKQPDLNLAQIVLPKTNETVKTMDTILRKLSQNEDFANLAIAHSKGPTALRGGVIGWRKALQFPDEIKQAIEYLEPGQYTNVITSGDALFIYKVYDKRESAKQQTVQQQKVRHILLTSSAIRDSEQTYNLIKLLADKIENLEDFKKTARKYSEDYSNSLQGGDLDWVYPGQMVVEFEQTMNGANLNQVAGPVQTQFGWHLLWVEARRDVDVSDKIIQGQAMQLLRSRRFEEELKLWQQELRNDSYIEYIKDRKPKEIKKDNGKDNG